MWRNLRIIVLLFILATVAQQALLKDGAPDWRRPLNVALYVLNGDASAASAGYIAQIQPEQFEAISDYMASQAADYGLPLRQPFSLRLGPAVTELPPSRDVQAGVLQNILWSLQFRFWAWRHSTSGGIKPDIKLYLLYFDPQQNRVLPHSHAMSKGRVGMLHVFASARAEAQNNVVIAHELLHTVGATDKYDLSNNQPIFPQGYAAPEQQPLYPQTEAELMAGRIPLSQSQASMPDDLTQTRVGELSAQEIGWHKTKK